MILCNLCDEKFDYEFEKLIRLFMPFEKIEVLHSTILSGDRAVQSSENGKLKSELFIGEKYECVSADYPVGAKDEKKETERILSVCLFKCFKELTGYKPPFGILTGVRPARLFSVTAKEQGEKAAEEFFENKLLVDSQKTDLIKQTAKSEEEIISRSDKKSFSLYIGIPFCPSRCSYCSFVSHSVENAKDLIPEYVEKLCEEIRLTGEIANKLNLKLMTVYMGGGTPTTLSAKQLEKIFDTVKESFDLSGISEYTVEAGRPDTITEEKLKAVKAANVTRISINPQSMTDSVLQNVGRRHTAEQTAGAFMLARKCGFDNINADLIAGLPGETPETFKSSLEKLLKLNPESITVHSLSMKRASTLTKMGEFPEIEMGKAALGMVQYARETLTKNGYDAYYMYRQSKTVGNLENVGYAKPGFEGLYNVYIMDETHTILACGASAVTKMREYNKPHIERIFNFKYPYEYIGRFEEQMQRKERITEFYDKYFG